MTRRSRPTQVVRPRYSISVDVEAHARVRADADRRGVSVDRLVEEALDREESARDGSERGRS